MVGVEVKHWDEWFYVGQGHYRRRPLEVQDALVLLLSFHRLQLLVLAWPSVRHPILSTVYSV